MFDHVKFGVSDYAASKTFFLKALEPLGVAVASEGSPAYGVEDVRNRDSDRPCSWDGSALAYLVLKRDPIRQLNSTAGCCGADESSFSQIKL